MFKNGSPRLIPVLILTLCVTVAHTAFTVNTVNAAAGKSAGTSSVVIFPFDGVNVSDDIGAAVAELFESAMIDNGFEVFDWRVARDRVNGNSVAKPLSLATPIPDAPAEISNTDRAPAEASIDTDGTAEASSAPLQNTVAPPNAASEVANATAEEVNEAFNEKLDENQKQAIGKAAGVSQYVDGKLVRLGTKFTIKVTMKTLSGEVIEQKHMKAANENDLYLALTRIATALRKNVSTDETQTLNNATYEEATAVPNRTIPQNYNGFTLGGGPIFGNVANFGLMTGGYQGIWEVRRMRLGINLALNFGSHETRFALSGGLSAAVYLAEKNVSPYLGGGAGAYLGDLIKRDVSDDDLYDNNDDANLGFMGYPTFGVEFLRQTRIRLYVELKYFLLVSSNAEVGHGPQLGFGMAFY